MGDVKHREAVIDWDVPAGRTDWLFGTGATARERTLVGVVVLAGAAAVLLVSAAVRPGWAWWQWLLVLFLVVDVLGGVVANSLGSAKRLYSGPVSSTSEPRRFLHHVVFAAAHVHLLVVAAAFDPTTWRWAGYWYAVCVAGVIVVRRVPIYLQRPLGVGLTALGLVAGEGFTAPEALTWLGPVLALKLVVAHSITEAPFRPTAEGSDQSR